MKFNEIKTGQCFISSAQLYLYLKLEGSQYTIVGYLKKGVFTRPPDAGSILTSYADAGDYIVVDAKLGYEIPKPPPQFEKGQIVRIAGSHYHNFFDGALGEVLAYDSTFDTPHFIVRSVHSTSGNPETQTLRVMDLELVCSGE